jgi:hypothetical protein
LGLSFPQFTCPRAEEASWPPFLPRSGDVRSDEAVEQTWNKKTFERRLSPGSVEAPIDLYVALISAPEVVAAAANHLGLTTSTLTLVSDRSYEWRSDDGSRVLYRVLLNNSRQQVTLSQGRLMVHGLGVRGSVLGNLRLSSQGGGVQQELIVYVHVENTVLAWFTKVFVALIPKTVDAELSHGFEITGTVARWAWQNREDFCRWARQSAFEPQRLRPIVELTRCAVRGEAN